MQSVQHSQELSDALREFCDANNVTLMTKESFDAEPRDAFSVVTQSATGNARDVVGPCPCCHQTTRLEPALDWQEVLHSFARNARLTLESYHVMPAYIYVCVTTHVDLQVLNYCEYNATMYIQ